MPVADAEGERPAGIVVIGAGPSGLAVATRLPDARVLEARDAAGGRAPAESVQMMVVGSEEQAEAGVTDSVEQALADWETLTGGPPTAATSAFLEASDGVRDWLADRGVLFGELGSDPVLGRRRYLITQPDGVSVAAALEGATSAEIQLNTRVTDLLFDERGVVGVSVGGNTIEAGTVVIASGGFANRADVVAKVTGWSAGTWDVGDDAFGTGDAIDWAAAHGLGTDALSAVGVHADVIGLPNAEGVATRDGCGVPWIWVDATGHRFVDETAGWSLALGAALDAHAPVWGIGPSDALLAGLDDADRSALAAGLVCADDAAALSDVLGIDVVDTLRDLGDDDDPTGRDRNTFVGMDDGPLCAFPPGRLASKNFGGLAVDDDGRVLDTAGAVVPGLWAVGEAAGMLAPGAGGRFGFDGSMTAVVWSGFRTGDAIARLTGS